MLIPGGGTKMPYAMKHSQKMKRKKLKQKYSSYDKEEF